ncbi:MAG: hypothetical protein H7837_05980 [Magnetococcus sp. MYC-9]
MDKCTYYGFKLIVDIATASLAFITAYILAKRYFVERRRDMVYKDYEARCKMIENESYKNIRSKIEHNDEALETIFRLVDGSDGDPYTAKLTPEQKTLHEDFDAYINYLEAVALLIRNGNILTEDTGGVWDYYLARILEWEPSHRYVSYPPYGWNLFLSEAKKAQERLEQRKRERYRSMPV